MRKVVGFAMVMLALTASMAFAAKGEFLMGGLAGVGVPTGDLKDFADPGFAGGVYGDYGVAKDCTLGATFLYNGYDIGNDIIKGLGATDVTFWVMQFTGHGRYWIPTSGAIAPFLTIGGGVYNGKTKVEGGTFASDESKSKGGIFGGVGADYKVGTMWRIGAEGNYHYIFNGTSDSSGKDTAAQVFSALGRLTFTFAGQMQ